MGKETLAEHIKVLWDGFVVLIDWYDLLSHSRPFSRPEVGEAFLTTRGSNVWQKTDFQNLIIRARELLNMGWH